MELSVIIVSYNVKDLLQQAINSLLVATKDMSSEFFVVDNHSKDQSAEMVKNHFPEVNLIVNAKNVGFSAANNQAIAKAQGKFILVINPDTVTNPDTLNKALNFLNTREDIGCLGVRMLNAKGDFLPESKRGLPTPWVSFCKLSGLYRISPKSKLFNSYYMGWINEFETTEVDVLPGAFMLFRASAIKNVGLFDEAFFMYGEDIDLSYRLKLAGYKNYYFPETYITHFKGQSTRKFSFKYILSFYGSMFIFVRKHFLKF